MRGGFERKNDLPLNFRGTISDLQFASVANVFATLQESPQHATGNGVKYSHGLGRGCKKKQKYQWLLSKGKHKNCEIYYVLG